MTRRVTILAAAAALMLGSCGSDIADDTTTMAPDALIDAVAPVDTTEGTQEMQDSGTPTPPSRTDRSYASDEYPDELGGFIGIAIADLAAREGANASDISVLSVEEVVWPNAAMGCPKPGMAYKQVPEDGLRIVLAYGAVEYAYHSGGRINPFLCAPGPGPVKEPVVPQIDITDPATYPGATTTDSIPPLEIGDEDKADETVPTEQVGGPGDPDD